MPVSPLTGRSITTTTTRSTRISTLSPRTGSYGAGLRIGRHWHPAGTEGWSARGGWYAPGVEGESPHRRVAINAYIHDASVNAEGVSIAGTPTPMIFSGLKKTDGIASSSASSSTRYPWMAFIANSDGIFQSWVDGRLACDKQNVKWRAAYQMPRRASLRRAGTSPNSQYLVRLVFGRRRRPSTAPVTLRLADVVVARDYIGPRT